MFESREVGKRIQERRKQKGLTQEQLGQACCISVQAVSKWENGESLPNIGTFPAFCKTLGVSADALQRIHPVHRCCFFLKNRQQWCCQRNGANVI